MVKIALCDDMEHERKKLGLWLEQYSKENNVQLFVDYFASGLELLQHYGHQYDLVILDVEMPEISGIETARQIRKEDEVVIIMFATHHRDYAVEGFRVDASSYFIKNSSYKEFALELERVLKKVKKQNNHIMIGDKQYGRFVAISSIVYVQYYDHKVTFHFMNGVEEEMRMSLKSILGQDVDSYFLQIHRGTIVNKLWIESCEQQTIKLRGIPELFFVSRPKWREVEDEYLKFCRRNII